MGFWRNLWRWMERGNRYIWARLRSGLIFADSHNGAITALATVAIVVLTFYYVTYSKKQWEEMRNARRPWVGLSERLTVKRPSSSAAFDAVMSSTEGEKEIVVTKFYLSGTLQNFGTSPARRVYEFFRIVQNSELRYLSRESYCKVAGSESRGENPFPQFSYFIPQPAKAIFPNVSIPIEDTFDFSMFVGKLHQMPNPIWIVGCVAYQDTFGEVHHTKVLYRSTVPYGTRQETVIENPLFTYAPFTEFVMEDSDGD
jgi:hypothetical protein